LIYILENSSLFPQDGKTLHQGLPSFLKTFKIEPNNNWVSPEVSLLLHCFCLSPFMDDLAPQQIAYQKRSFFAPDGGSGRVKDRCMRTGPSRREKKPPPKANRAPPDGEEKKSRARNQTHFSGLTAGDLCIVLDNMNLNDPVLVMKILSLDLETEEIVAQNYGRYTSSVYIDRRLRQPYLPAWIQGTEGRFYYRHRSSHPSHRPFTNVHADKTHLTISDIAVFGFSLLSNHRLPPGTVTTALEAWRRMGFDPQALGVATYEARDAQMPE
jgi:hypothetical protein